MKKTDRKSGKKRAGKRVSGDGTPQKAQSRMPTTEAESLQPIDQPTSNLFPPEVSDAVRRAALRVGKLLSKRCGSQEEYERGLQRISEWLFEWGKVAKDAAYPQLVQQLQSVLLGLGGSRVVSAGPDSHLKRILESGKVISPKAIREFRGEPSQCHQNVAELYLTETYDGAQIATGYGLSEDGIWRSHSWLVRGDEIIETTVPRTAYFGYVLPLEAALAFCGSESWRASQSSSLLGSNRASNSFKARKRPCCTDSSGMS